jgi:hypothetical protein
MKHKEDKNLNIRIFIKFGWVKQKQEYTGRVVFLRMNYETQENY